MYKHVYTYKLGSGWLMRAGLMSVVLTVMNSRSAWVIVRLCLWKQRIELGWSSVEEPMFSAHWALNIYHTASNKTQTPTTKNYHSPKNRNGKRVSFGRNRRLLSSVYTRRWLTIEPSGAGLERPFRPTRPLPTDSILPGELYPVSFLCTLNTFCLSWEKRFNDSP